MLTGQLPVASSRTGQLATGHADWTAHRLVTACRLQTCRLVN